MSNSFSLAQAPISALSPARELSYGNLTAAIRRFEAGMALGTKAKRGGNSRFRAIPMMTKENSNPKLAKLGRPISAF